MSASFELSVYSRAGEFAMRRVKRRWHDEQRAVGDNHQLLTFPLVGNTDIRSKFEMMNSKRNPENAQNPMIIRRVSRNNNAMNEDVLKPRGFVRKNPIIPHQ